MKNIQSKITSCILSSIIPLCFNQTILAEPSIETVDPARIELEDTLKSNDPKLKPEKKKKKDDVQVKNLKEIKKFMFRKAIIKGNSVISSDKLLEITKPFLNTDIGINTLNEIADKMTALYRGKGYILSQVIIPQQNIQDGNIYFQVIEGFIDKVHIDDNKLNINTNIIKSFSNKLNQEVPFNIDKLERIISIANELPGVKIKSYFSPSKDKVGGADLTLRVEERTPFESFIIIDNKLDKQYGSLQATAGTSFNHSNLSDTTQVLARTSSHERIKLASISHTHYFHKDGLKTTVSLQKNKTKPHFENNVIQEIIGSSNNFSASTTYSIIKTRKKELSITGIFDALNSSSKGERYFIDRIRSIRAAINYDFIDKLWGSNHIGLEFSKGLKALGATATPYTRGDSASLITYSRPGGRSDYSKANLTLTRLQYLPNNLSILLSAESQWSAHELLSAEEFGFGGSHYGRGYENSSFVGDAGLKGKLEFRYDYSPNTIKFIRNVQPYLFYDAAYITDKGGIKLRDNPGAQASVNHMKADSGGFGLRVNFKQKIFAQVELGKPFSKQNLSGNKKSQIKFSINTFF